MSINLINIARFALCSAFGRGSKMIRYYANRILAAMYQHCEFEPDRGKKKIFVSYKSNPNNAGLHVQTLFNTVVQEEKFEDTIGVIKIR